MIVSKSTLEKIKNIIQRNYRGLLISTAGKSVLSEKEIEDLQKAGFDVTNESSLLSLIYYNNVLNDLKSPQAPNSIPEMKAQQKVKPVAEVHIAAEEHLNENYAQNVEKFSAEAQAKIEGIVREFNSIYRNKVIGDDLGSDAISDLFKQSSVGGLKQAIRSYVETAENDFQRVAITETANAMGLGSIDRVILQNPDKSPSEIYVYRIPVNDAALCKFCRKFYLDGDNTPALYKLSTLLSNGSNYGKKAIDWKAVAGATHPNDRESGVMELRPGWQLKAEGGLDFIGLDAWKSYIEKKLRD